MSDDPLAHLYADFADEDDLEEPAIVTTSLDALVSDPGELEEEISESDLDELVLLVGARLAAGRGLPDHEAAELGLGTIEETVGADLDHELVLNATGRAVLKRLVAEHAPGISFGPGGENV